MTAAKSTRVTNVQVPGAPPADQPDTELNAGSAGATQQESDQGDTDFDVGMSGASLAGADQTPAAVDLEALKAQLLEQARAEARAELSTQLEAAQTVVNALPAAPARGARNYRAMRADQVDPTTLTQPVLTLDGWVCPPAPEKK